MNSSLCSFSEKTPPYQFSLRCEDSLSSGHAAGTAENMRMESSLIGLIVSSVMYLRAGRSIHRFVRAGSTNRSDDRVIIGDDADKLGAPLDFALRRSMGQLSHPGR